MKEGGAADVLLQPVAIAYTKLQGMPISRAERPEISGVSARGFRQVVKALLSSGTKDVTIAFGTPMPFPPDGDRKVLAKRAENEVRRMLVALNRGQQVIVDHGAVAVPPPTPVVVAA
jgi:1-acyl-sn-glycerol-3-phosphate acyltransferase